MPLKHAAYIARIGIVAEKAKADYIESYLRIMPDMFAQHWWHI